MRKIFILFCAALISCNRDKCHDRSFVLKDFLNLSNENSKSISTQMFARVDSSNKINDTTKIHLTSEISKGYPDFILKVNDIDHIVECNIYSVEDNRLYVGGADGDSIEILLSSFANKNIDSIDQFYGFYIHNTEIPMSETTKTRIFLIGNIMYKVLIFSEDIPEVDLIASKISKILYNDYMRCLSDKYKTCINNSVKIKEVDRPIGY